MIYKGSCYCGNVVFEVEGYLESVMVCNCLICQCEGLLLWFVVCDKVWLLMFEDNVSIYFFCKYVIKYCFCLICGIYLYVEGVMFDGMLMIVINVCCLEDIDLVSVLVIQFDGWLMQCCSVLQLYLYYLFVCFDGVVVWYLYCIQYWLYEIEFGGNVVLLVKVYVVGSLCFNNVMVLFCYVIQEWLDELVYGLGWCLVVFYMQCGEQVCVYFVFGCEVQCEMQCIVVGVVVFELGGCWGGDSEMCMFYCVW